MTRDRLPLLLIPLAALIVILPLLLHGCSCGHDLNFHLLSWQEAATQFAHGTLHPRWAFSPAFGAGEPRFVFYPPLSWTLGGLLTLAAAAFAHLLHLRPEGAFAVMPILYTWIALTAAGLSMHHLARRFVSPATALLAATVYLANPYTLFTAFERTAIAELLAAAILPLLLAALLPAPHPIPPNEPALSIPAVAIPVALLWLTNAPAAVIGSYSVALLLLLRLLLPPHSGTLAHAARKLLLPAAVATLLAFALAAFYLVPALLERSWVQISMAILPGLRPDDNTLFHHTADAFHDTVLHTASLIALLLLAATLSGVLLSSARLRRTDTVSRSTLPLLLAIVAVILALLLTPLSLPLWHHLPQLAFLQFPWRLLALLAPIAVLAVALAIDSLKLSRLPLTALALALPTLLVLPSFHVFNQSCDREDTPQSRFALFRSRTGDDPTDEYTPITADNDSLKDNNPPFRLLPADADDDTPPPTNALPGPAPHALSLDLSRPALLILNLRDYPTWIVTLNGHLDRDRDHRADGLLTIALPAGHNSLVLSHRTPPAEFIADGISAAALVLTATALLRKRRPLLA